MNRDQVISKISDRLDDTSVIDPQCDCLVVDPSKQTLELFSAGSTVPLQYAVSTARNGLGNQKDSYQTPTGVHRIAEKIGANEPSGMVFRGRQATGELAADLDNREEDQITSRILWLQGLEPGFNQGDECDSYDRYIYIHGTSDEQRIGEPVSAGCVRMRNRDVIELFDNVDIGAFVLILDN